MKQGIPLKERIRYAFGRAKGIPVETDLSRYRALVVAMRRIDLGAAADGDLSSAARSAANDAGRLACVVEACRRGLGLEPFEGQLVGALAMAAGRVAQMQTGEGKTLAAAISASLMALSGTRVHILTANDYLAARDAQWMGPLYRLLGLCAASVTARSTPDGRTAAYRSDICHLTARELGFDYLRDGLAAAKGEIVQLPYEAVIVDEADFVLIDEARVPLVIAGAAEGDGLDLVRVDAAAASLRHGIHFHLDREGRRVALTMAGERRLAEILGAADADGNLEPGFKARSFAALHARHLLARDVDYLVKEGKVALVDGFTGRVAERRQWPWGIQAALEAKEGLAPSEEGRIYASITVQNLIGIYPRRAAMTATAVRAAEELSRVYGMPTLIIPPEKPCARIDRPDAVFRDRASRDEAVRAEILRAHGQGRPVLVGTRSVRESESLARALAAAGLGCAVLNARNDADEAALVTAAGRPGAVTISTNMAGRGTDIRLGGDARALGAGGLLVIGTSRHESRRVDEQLRGRAGRQGEPGESRFFVSLEDELFDRFGVRNFLPPAWREAGVGLVEESAVDREVDRAQSLVEGQNSKIRDFLVRRSLLVEYDRRYLRRLRDEALLEGILPEDLEEALAAVFGNEAVESGRPRIAAAFIARLDALWADHLALVEEIREGLGLRVLGGRRTNIEFVSSVADAFEAAMRDLEAAALEDGRDILSGREIGSGRALGEERAGPPPRPSSTWTYVVDEDASPGYDPGLISGIAAFALGPLAAPAFFLERIVKAWVRKRPPPP